MSATLDAPVLETSARVFAGRTRSGHAFEVFDRIAGLDPLVWQAAFPARWKDYRYHQTLEETFSREFPQRYLVLRAESVDGEDAPARAILPLFFVEQDLTVSLSPRLRRWLRPLRRRLTLRLLMAGCIAGDGQVGMLDPADDLAAVCAELDEALASFARRERVSILLFKDMPEAYRPAMAALTARGRYTRLPSLPGVSLPLDFATFEEYLQARPGKATRKSLRRKFREVDALAEPLTLEVKNEVDARRGGCPARALCAGRTAQRSAF